VNNRYILSLILLVISPFVNANTCEIDGYLVGFFNGIQTTALDGQQNIDSLEVFTQTPSYNGENVEYKLFYNSSLKDIDVSSVFDDMSETFAQRSLEYGITPKYEWLMGLLNPRANAAILNTIAYTSEPFAYYLTNEFNGILNEALAEMLDLLRIALDGASADTEEDTMRHELINDTYTWEGKKLIYVAHSQGNLWVNQSYEYVLNQEGYSDENIKIIHVAPASVDLNGEYILFENDIVIHSLGILSGGFIDRDSNVSATLAEQGVNLFFDHNFDILGHNFQKVYLDYSESKARLTSLLDDAFSTVKDPELEEHLYQIEIVAENEVSTAFSPVGVNFTQYYDLTDPSDAYFFESITKPFSYHNIVDLDVGLIASIDSLSFKEEIETSTATNTTTTKLTITQCDRPSSVEDYAIQTLNYVDKGNNGLNSTYSLSDNSATVLIIDRYGQPSNLKTFDDFGYLISWGTYTTLKFSQDNVYNATQKAMLVSENLSGKYELGSEIYFPWYLWID
jgi:hypothetical protein